MKKLLLITTLMTLMTQAFAGILENRATGETLEFNLDRKTREVEILSTANNVENKYIKMNSIKEATSSIKLYGITERACREMFADYAHEIGSCLLLPVLFVPGLTVGAIETLMIPFKAPVKMFQNMKYNKDFKKLLKAINSTRSIKVSNKRFRRIEKLLVQQ